MTRLFTIFALLGIFYVSAQDSTSIKVETPKIISKLKYGKTIAIQDLEFKFIAVESDSRCPKGVQCIWAGEAVVLVDVIKNGVKLEQKRLKFLPTAPLENLLGNLFSSQKLNISGLNILPYPVYKTKIKPEDYYLELDVR